MKKKLLVFALVLCMALTMLPGAAFAAWSGVTGTGTEADPYLINNAADLKAFSDYALANSADIFKDKYVKLNADIDWQWADWKPFIFYGTFDGGNHTIKNLTYVADSSGRMGFFQSLSGPAKDLTLDGIKAEVPIDGRFGGFARYHFYGAWYRCSDRDRRF